MRIGDEVYIHGYVDEIRQDTIIIHNDGGYFGTIPNEITRIDDTPSIDTESKQGEWIEEYHGNGWNDYWDYTCSNCGKKYERADDVLYKANFCPNCGARMKGADDE